MRLAESAAMHGYPAESPPVDRKPARLVAVRSLLLNGPRFYFRPDTSG
jgi:hypothetical protein